MLRQAICSSFSGSKMAKVELRPDPRRGVSLGQRVEALEKAQDDDSPGGLSLGRTATSDTEDAKERLEAIAEKIACLERARGDARTEPERERLEREIVDLRKEAKRNYDKHGQARKRGPRETHRVAVYQAIETAKRHIKEAGLMSLWQHLEKCIPSPDSHGCSIT